MRMHLTFLGTGTSTGVPQLRCDCDVCHSTDPADHRMRTSALLEIGEKNFLIDCGPDFRQQMLLYNRHGNLDALLITHHHYDHVGGTDDLRPYCKGKDAFPVYCQAAVARDLHRRMPYCFEENPYPGVPRYDINIIEPLKPFYVDGIQVLSLPINHYKLDIVGFKIGNLAYITDAKHVPDSTIDAIRGVDTLVINALRHEEHISHLSLREALDVVSKINPNHTYLTHLSHGMGLAADLPSLLPKNVQAAHDGLRISIE